MLFSQQTKFDGSLYQRSHLFLAKPRFRNEFLLIETRLFTNTLSQHIDVTSLLIQNTNHGILGFVDPNDQLPLLADGSL